MARSRICAERSVARIVVSQAAFRGPKYSSMALQRVTRVVIYGVNNAASTLSPALPPSLTRSSFEFHISV